MVNCEQNRRLSKRVEEVWKIFDLFLIFEFFGPLATTLVYGVVLFT